MRTGLSLLWDHNLATMAGLYVLLLVLVNLALFSIWRPKRPQARYNAIALTLMLALIPWLGVKVLIHAKLGGQAMAIAQQMPSEHPQLAVFKKARAEFDVSALNSWAAANRDPVDAKVIRLTQLAIEKLPPSSFKAQLEAELATGYLSKARFEASALSIIRLSAKELGHAEPSTLSK